MAAPKGDRGTGTERVLARFVASRTVSELASALAKALGGWGAGAAARRRGAPAPRRSPRRRLRCARWSTRQGRARPRRRRRDSAAVTWRIGNATRALLGSELIVRATLAGSTRK